MSDELETVDMNNMVLKFQQGNAKAINDLIVRTQQQLEHLTRKMLRSFPGVHSQEQTGDVLQNSLVRLTRALKAVTPKSMREYYGLAAEQIRRELLDLARYYSRRGTSQAEDAEHAAPEIADLDNWAALQAAVENLPVEQREVFGLTFYHGWTQPQIAELLQISDRQVRRIWTATCVELNKALAGKLPDF